MRAPSDLRPPFARLLAIDSSTERLCLALSGGAGAPWTCTRTGGPQASAQLLPAVRQALDAQGLTLASLDAIAFARGPGAFTGLRTACSVAQGLAFGAGRPVLPLDSLCLVAEDARAQAGDALPPLLWVAMDARMDEVYASAYRFEDGRWQAAAEPALYTLPALAARWQAEPPPAVAGSALAAFGDRLPVSAALTFPREVDRAGALARVAEQAWQAGAACDPAEALPLYLRDKVALTTAERDLARAAGEDAR